MMAQDPQERTTVDERDVTEFLRRNPDFLLQNPELLEVLTPPQQQTGSNRVLDFQHYALSSLQRGMQSMKDRFEGLLSSARDNMSAQSQIHKAVIEMLRAKNLASLLEVITTDLPRYFDVDAVRIVLESDLAELYGATYSEASYSGISFVPTDTVDLALGVDQPAALVADTQHDPPYAYDHIFVDCGALIQSCALLRLRLDRIGRDGILAFGVREKHRFHPHQGTDLLCFLSEVTGLRLNQSLNEEEVEALL